MEFCGAGSVSDLMKIRNKTVSDYFELVFPCSLYMYVTHNEIYPLKSSVIMYRVLRVM